MVTPLEIDGQATLEPEVNRLADLFPRRYKRINIAHRLEASRLVRKYDNSPARTQNLKPLPNNPPNGVAEILGALYQDRTAF